jgi:hypothetical protein
MLQDTTTTSYEQNIRPNLTVLHAEVRRALRTFPEGLTNQEIGKLLGKAASTISGIVGPMAKRKEKVTDPEPQLFNAGKRKCSITGNTAIFWRLIRYQQPPVSEAAKGEMGQQAFL